MACALLAIGLAFAPSATAEPEADRVYTNPILPGDWSDPGLIRVGDYFYTVRSSFGWQPGLPIARSRDLVHWELIGQAVQDGAAAPKSAWFDYVRVNKMSPAPK